MNVKIEILEPNAVQQNDFIYRLKVDFLFDKRKIAITDIKKHKHFTVRDTAAQVDAITKRRNSLKFNARVLHIYVTAYHEFISI